MLGLVTYMLILTALSVGVWRQPTVGVAAVLCLYGLKQWGQSMTAFFSEHGQFTNFAVASIALVGLLRAASRRGCLFCRVPSTTVLVVVLYLYAFLSLTWAPDIYVSLEQWGSQGPYILTVALLAPLLFADFEDAQVAFTWTAMTGAVICMLALVFGKWGSRGLLLFNDTHEWETNPLALSSMAGTVFLIAALSFGQPKRLWMKVFSIVLIPVSIAVILRSGSRGQLIASGVGLMAALPIAFRTTAPEWRIWTEISQKFDLNFIELPDDLLAKLAQEGEQERGTESGGTVSGRRAADPDRRAHRHRDLRPGRCRTVCLPRRQSDGRTAGTAAVETSELFLQHPQRVESV